MKSSVEKCNWRSHGGLHYLLFCVALLPIILLRDYTPDNELRYLSIVDEAMRNHTFFTFANHGIPYADKPPLYFWFVMLGKWLLGSHQMWFLSLGSLVPALVIVRTMENWIASDSFEVVRGMARTMLLTAGLFAGLAVTLRMDMLMCMFIVLALRSFYRMYTRMACGGKDAWLFPVYLFLAVFSKGPLGLLLPLGSTVVFLLWTGRTRQFGKYWGWRTWLVLVSASLLWFGAVYAEGGQAYLDNLLFHQTVDRAVNAFHHKAPFYYYGVSVWYSIAPWSLLVVGLLVAAAVRKLYVTDLQRFFCSVMLSVFVILSCISSKLQVYLLPAFPFAICLAAMYFQRFSRAAWLKGLVALTSAVFVAVLPALLVVLSTTRMDYLRHPAVYMAAVAMTLSGLSALYCSLRLADRLALSVRMLAAGLVCTFFVGGWALPALNPQIGYEALCRASLDMAREKKTDRLATWGVRRANNMDVYLGRVPDVIESPDVEEVRTLHHTVLMIPQKNLHQFDADGACLVGRFAVVYLK